MNPFYRLYSCLLFLFFAAQAMAQNMVPNCSFEQRTSCPTGISQMSSCTGWSSYHLGTSDVFNICATKASTVSLPGNFMGWQYAASDSAYAGIMTFSPGADYKEYITRSITPLTVGMPYEVSMSVNLADSVGFATADLGALFFLNGPTSSATTYGYLRTNPQVSFKTYGSIMDTMNWVRITGSFFADSAYSHIIIGGFDNPLTMWAPFTGMTKPYAYYYIDSVVVKPTNISCAFTDTAYCQHDSIKVQIRVNTPAFAVNNVFSLELSDATGSFASPNIIASIMGNAGGQLYGVVPSGTPTGRGYRLRVTSSNVVDSTATSGPITIGGSRPARPDASVNSPICEPDRMTLFATDSTAGVTYKWQGPGNFWSNVQNPVIYPVFATNSGRYIVTAWLDGCSSSDTLQVNIIATANFLLATTNTPVCEYDTLKLHGVVAGSTVTNVRWVRGPGLSNVFSYALDTILVHPPAGFQTFYLVGDVNVCHASTTATALVKPVPPNFQVTANTPVCEGDPLNIRAPLTINGLTFAWKGPGGFTSTLQNLIYSDATVAQTGRFTVIGAVNGCYAWDTVDIEVRPALGLIQNNNSYPVCVGDTLKLFGAALAPNHSGFLWVGPNGFTGQSKDTILAPVTAAMSGRYILFSNFNNCSSSDTLDILIKPVPAPFDALYNTPLCDGDTLKLTGNTDTSVHSFTWQGPAGFTAASRDTAIVPAHLSTAGDYLLTGYYNGCIIKDNVLVSIKPLPTGIITSANTPLCEADSLKLGSNSASSGATYSWAGPDNFTANGQYVSLAVALSSAGNYIVTANLDGCTGKDTIAIMVNPIPQKPDATGNSPLKTGDILLLHINNEQTNVNYTWTGPSGFQSSALNPVLKDVTISNSGTYIVKANLRGCTSSDSVTIIVLDVPDTSFFVVYPNANNGNFTIAASAAREQEVPLKITASNGQLVYEATAQTQHKRLNVNVALKDALSSGVYTLHVKLDGELHRVRLLVVRNP